MDIRAEIESTIRDLECICAGGYGVDFRKTALSTLLLLRQICKLPISFHESDPDKSADYAFGLYLDTLTADETVKPNLANDGDKIVVYLARHHRSRGVMWSKDSLYDAVTNAKTKGLSAEQPQLPESP